MRKKQENFRVLLLFFFCCDMMVTEKDGAILIDEVAGLINGKKGQ